MTELILKKRQGRAGEVGLFLDVPVAFDDEWSCLPMGAEIKAECTVPGNLKYLKFHWALCGLVAENTSHFVDKRDASNRILIEAGHYKIVQRTLTGETEIKTKSVAGLSADKWIELLKAETHVVTTEYLPGMEDGVLTREIEGMLGFSVYDQP